MQQDSINSYLKEARIKKGLTQGEIAKHLGLTSSQYISNIERGLCPASLETIQVLIQLYDLKTSKVMDILIADYRKTLEKKFVKKTKTKAK
ncbi:MAG: helix-turn-helix transcriptional regulator [Bdellovibrionota bacterium]